MDIVMAVNMGGDDYVTKPFSMDILLVKNTGTPQKGLFLWAREGQIIECNGAILNLNDGY